MLRYMLPIRLYVVRGQSMSPTLLPGQLLLGSYYIKPKVGHIAVIARNPLSIKRIKRIDSKGVWVEGDNTEASTDSRSFGYLKQGQIESVIFFKIG